MSKQSLNVVMLSGNLVRDPEQVGSSENPMVRASLAMSTWKGERQFVNLVFWSKTGAVVMEHCQKGTGLTVRGQLQIRPYEKDGKTLYTTEVVVNEMFFGAQEAAEEVEAAPAKPNASSGYRRGYGSNTSRPTTKTRVVEVDDEELFN